jgi:predicted enzyme related to lactoylglutathione lyase
MARGVPNPVVHLELRTGDLACACAFYTRLFGWRADTLHTSFGDYTRLTPGDRIEGGVVEHETQRAYWLPYVEVTDMADLVERARLLGATALLSPREGPAGCRSVLAAPDGGVFALWQPKA